MKGFMQLQTIIYVVFAVIILMVGLFSVEAYLTNIKVDANYELDQIDLAIIGKRITSSCYNEIQTFDDFYVYDSGFKKNSINFNNNCFSGYSQDKIAVSFFDMNKNLIHKEGNLDCEYPDLNLFLLSENQDYLVEVCYEK